MNKSVKWIGAGMAAVAVLAGTYFAGTRVGANKATSGDAAKPAPAGAPGAPTASKGGTPGGPPPIAVDAARVKMTTLANTISAVGSLRSDEAVMVRPEVSGRIADINFAEGQRVEKGRVLIRLDQAVQRAELQQAEANLGLAQSRLDRSRDLHTKGFISSQARDEAESNFKVAQATHALAAARLTKLEIRAPFTGTVGLRSISVGDFVREGQDIVNLEEIDSLKVDFRVPEIFLKRVSTGQSLRVTLDAIPNKTFNGRILAINPLVDASGRAIVIRAQVKNSDTLLKPGMFARVSLITDEQKQGMTIPEQALIPVGDDFFVFKVVDGRVQRTKVELGQRITGFAEIVRGLAANDTVVTAGQPKLRDGGAVRFATLDGQAPAQTPTQIASPAAPPSPAPNAPAAKTQ
jgi:membrane fusion protein, multidrug efflux system